MNNNPIGVMDSGVGGLSIASELIKKLPKESFIYLADSKNCPYGEKSLDQIFELAKTMVQFLVKNNAKLVVIACNTITVSSILKLREEFPTLPIVGIVPVIKTAVKNSKSKKIGIFSTIVTANSDYQKKLIKDWAGDFSVLNLGSSRLVPLIEKFQLQSVENILQEELAPFKKAGIDTLALGCSHFPLIKAQIQKLLPNVLILDSAEAVSRQVAKILKHNKLLSKQDFPSYNFYTTGELESMEKFLDKLTSQAIIEKISLDESF